MFREPSPDGYASVHEFKSAETLEPLFAPKRLALRLDRLKLV